MNPDRQIADVAYGMVTMRPTVLAMEQALQEVTEVLDHGFVRLVDYMGSDGAIVQAARVSYGNGTKHVREDRGLIRYLVRHRHTSPLEMCEVKLHLKMPIFVARQWVRHRTANVNEISARYSILAREFYVPDAPAVCEQSTTNRQGRGDPLAFGEATAARLAIETAATNAFDVYDSLLNSGHTHSESRKGISRELARSVLPVATYTELYWKIDLHNLLHFLSLRCDPHAQYEIRAYADAIADLVRAWVPLTWEAFEDYRLGAITLSRMATDCVRRMLAGEPVTQETSGMSAGEWAEFRAALGLA